MKRSVYTRPDKPLRIAVKPRRDFDEVEIAAAPEVVAVDKATECHVTPPDVAKRMVRYLGPVGDYLTLEPSAGTGNLSRALIESGHSPCELVQVERHTGLARHLHKYGTVINRCFLEYAIEVRGKVAFPRIIANPPFRTVRRHIAAARALMGSNGHYDAPTLVALVPDTYETEGHGNARASPPPHIRHRRRANQDHPHRFPYRRSDEARAVKSDPRRRSSLSPNGPNHLVRRIEAEFASISAGIQRVPAPPGHRWEVSESELTWFAGDVIASTSLGGASIFLRRDPRCDEDPQQLHVELRIFWDREPRTVQAGRQMRATLWVDHGERIGFRARSLLAADASFLHADSAEALLQQAMSTIVGACQPFLDAAHIGPGRRQHRFDT